MQLHFFFRQQTSKIKMARVTGRFAFVCIHTMYTVYLNFHFHYCVLFKFMFIFIFMQHVNEAWTCNVDMQREDKNMSTGMEYGHAAWRHGHGAQT
jgi:hypothetical protein